MITTIFNKTRPFNYIIVSILLILAFLTFGFSHNLFYSPTTILFSGIVFFCMITMVLLANFIGIKNHLTRNNTYAVLFCFLFLLLFPQIFSNISCAVSSLFVLFATRRLTAVQSLQNIKQKIFDASILIFIATLFQFWAILFIVLVFIIIVFYAGRDYRNWIIPIVALFATSILFLVFSLEFNKLLLSNILKYVTTDVSLSYFSNTFQNIAFAIYSTLSVLFLTNAVITNSKKPLAHQALFRFIILNYCIAALFFVLSSNKDNSYLVFTIAPLAIMAANFFENLETTWIAETSAIIITVFALICFVGQL